jgi:formylglycine-generating enzyme required for sulfatase activity
MNEVRTQNDIRIQLVFAALLLTACSNSGPTPPLRDGKPMDAPLRDRQIDVPRSDLSMDGQRDQTVGATPRMITIQPGTFIMGSPDSEPCRKTGETRHEVVLTHTFEIQSTEVTQKQYVALMGVMPFSQCGLPCPVADVSWRLAAQYCNALSQKAGLAQCYTCTGADETLQCSVAAPYSSGGKSIYDCLGYRLPTEAEWEYSYRAGTTTALYNGPVGSSCDVDPNADAIGWYRANSGLKLQPVGLKQPNAWGLYDMAGNTWEWVNDLYVADLGTAKITNPAGPAVADIYRVIRGGSSEENVQVMRAANRNPYDQSGSFSDYGFRVARTLK